MLTFITHIVLWLHSFITVLVRPFRAPRVSALPCAVGILLAALFTGGAFAQTLILRVDINNGSTSGDGSAWGSQAIKYLQDALAAADAHHAQQGQEGDQIQIWVVEGVYLPAEDSSTPSCPTAQDPCDRDTSFMLRNNVRIYGGFNGTETDLSQRNVAMHATILDGDLMQDDDVTYNHDGSWSLDTQTYTDNSHHVVVSINTNDTAVLDGFTIRGGVRIIDSFIAMRNCTVTANADGVPALHIAGNSEPRIFRCTFNCSHGGSVIITDCAHPVFIDCTIDGEFRNLRTAADFGPHAAAAVPGFILAGLLRAAPI
jgi:hypothetical protein